MALSGNVPRHIAPLSPGLSPLSSSPTNVNNFRRQGACKISASHGQRRVERAASADDRRGGRGSSERDGGVVSSAVVGRARVSPQAGAVHSHGAVSSR